MSRTIFQGSFFHMQGSFYFIIFVLWFITFYWAGFYSCPEGKGTRSYSKVPHLTHPSICIRKTGTAPGSPYYFSNSAWVLFRPTELSTFKELWDGTSNLSSLSEKTRQSNHLQMKLQRQHFLLSYLKTLSVDPVGVSNSRPPVSQPGAQPSELPVCGSLNSNIDSIWVTIIWLLFGCCRYGPPVRTPWRVTVENLSTRISWQVRDLVK